MVIYKIYNVAMWIKYSMTIIIFPGQTLLRFQISNPIDLKETTINLTNLAKNRKRAKSEKMLGSGR